MTNELSFNFLYNIKTFFLVFLKQSLIPGENVTKVEEKEYSSQRESFIKAGDKGVS